MTPRTDSGCGVLFVLWAIASIILLVVLAWFMFVNNNGDDDDCNLWTDPKTGQQYDMLRHYGCLSSKE